MQITVKTGDGSSHLISGFAVKGVPRTYTVTPEQADRLRSFPLVIVVGDEPEPEPDDEDDDEPA